MPLPKHTWPGDSKLIPYKFHGPNHYCILFNKWFINTSFWDSISGLEIAGSQWAQWPKAGHILEMSGKNKFEWQVKLRNSIDILHFICSPQLIYTRSFS